MKKIFLLSAIFLSALSYNGEAQVSISINIGRQPVWGPAGYDYVDYYYLPDLDVYYDVPRSGFVYFDLGRWNFGASLPARYGRYDFYNAYKVVINEREPWMRNPYYRAHYARYRRHHQQLTRGSHDERYFVGRERHGNNGRWGEGRNYAHGNRGKNHERGHHGHGRGDDHDHDRHY